MIPCAPCAVFRHARGSRETPRRPGKRVRSQRRAAAPARFAGRLHAGAPLEGSGQLAPAWTPCSITAPCATPPSPRPAAAARRSRERAARRTTPRRMAFWHRGVPRVECGVCERSAPLSAPHVRAALALHLRLTCAAPRGWPARRGGAAAGASCSGLSTSTAQHHMEHFWSPHLFRLATYNTLGFGAWFTPRNRSLKANGFQQPSS